MSVPLSELPPPAGRNLREHERRQVSLFMPFTQALLNRPDVMDPLLDELSKRAVSEAPQYHREGIDTKVPLIPLMTVLGHKVAMKMLAGFGQAPPSRKTEIPILATVPAEAIYARQLDFYEKQPDPFVIASMQRLNPYFEAALEEVMQNGSPYAPIWQRYAELVPQNICAATDPALRDHDRRHNNINPISRLHNTLWQGVSTIPPFAINLFDLIYSDDVKTIRQFQEKAINMGAVGVLAKAPEIKKFPRNKLLGKAHGVIPIDYYEVDPDTGIIHYRDQRKSDISLTPNFAKIIEDGLTLCTAPIGLLDPSSEIQDVCQNHNACMGPANRSSLPFLPDNPENVTSMAEVFAYDALLTAPSTLWFPFLEAREITDWSDALPGTRLPDGTIIHRKIIKPPRQATVFAT